MMDNLLIKLQRQRKKRYESAQLVIDTLRKILIKKYNVKKIVLIGSCLNEDNFHSHSDIDLCVEGIPHNLFFSGTWGIINQGRGIQRGSYPYRGCQYEDERIYKEREDYL